MSARNGVARTVSGQTVDPPRAAGVQSPDAPWAASGHAGVGALPVYEPHPWLRGFHRMTLAAVFVRRDARRPVPCVERRVFAVDGTTSVVGLCSWQPHGVAPAVVLVHGLGGHADRPYMRGMARQAWAAGFHVVRLNLRNCGGTEALAGSLSHAGLVDDVLAVVTALVRDDPCRRLHLVGFSMGGNIVLRLGGLWGDAAPPQVASLGAISPSLDLGRSADQLDRLWSLRPYRMTFLRELRRVYARRAALFPERYHVARLRGVKTLRAFDERATAPDCGFPDVGNYYREASARALLDRIRVRSLVLHARDDLMAPLDGELEQALRQAPCVALEASAHGGHCAFLSRQRLGPGGNRSWAEHRMLEFLCQEAIHGEPAGRQAGRRN